MDLYVNLLLGLGWLLFIGYFLRLWRKEYLHLRQMRRDAQARVEQRVSEPAPQPGTMQRPNYRAVALLDQVDALIHRMDEQEMEDVMEEMQRRGW